MIKCPKCGFEQPPDQYCARCGINIATFKAPPVPWSRKLSGSGGFYIFLLATVVISTVYFIFIRTSQNVTYDTEFEKIALPPREVLEKKVQDVPEPSEEKKFHGGVAATASLTATDESSNEKETDEITVPREKVVAEKPAAAQRAKTQLTVYFLEIPQTATSSLFAGSDGGSIGVVPQFATHRDETKTVAQIKELARDSKIITTPNTPLRFDQILNESTGLYIRVVPTSVSENSMTIEVHIENRFSFGAAGAAPTVQDFDGVFTLANNAAAYFADVLPRNPAIKPEESSVFRQHPVFKVLSSQSYLSNSTEFLIFFEATGLAENP